MNDVTQDQINKRHDDHGRWSGRGLVIAMAIVTAIYLYAGIEFALGAEQPWDTTILKWSHDGSCGTACPLQGMEIQRASTPTAAAWTSVANLAPTVRTFTINGVAEGPACYRLIATGTGGGSLPSDVTCKTTIAPALKTLKTVAGDVYSTGSFDVTAWLVKRNKLYGTIPTGIACDESKPAKDGFWRVPVASVRWTNTRARTANPIARCELQ